MLHEAATLGNLELIKFLLDNGADINSVNYPKQTEMHFVGDYGHDEIVEFFIGKQMDVNAKNHIGQTVLHELATNGKIEVNKLLMKNEVHLTTETNAEILQIAVQNNQSQI